MRRIILVLILSLTIMTGMTFATPKQASAVVESQCDGSKYLLGFPTWYRYLDVGGPECEIIGPPAADSTPDNIKIDWQKAAGRIGLAVIEIMLRIAALVAVAYVIYGGFRYITSQGEPENAKSARQTIMNGLIGLVISLIATGTVAFIATTLTS